jgi:hypothetical protein
MSRDNEAREDWRSIYPVLSGGLRANSARRSPARLHRGRHGARVDRIPSQGSCNRQQTRQGLLHLLRSEDLGGNLKRAERPEGNFECTVMLEVLGSELTRTAYRSPWQNGVAERWVGSCRRELLDHAIVLNESHLRRLVREYVIITKIAFMMP